MTFAIDGYSALLLKHASERNTSVSLVASDVAPSIFQSAEEMARRHPNSVLTPIQSK